MNFNELVEAVVVNTNRPELLNETTLAVQRSTIKMHSLDFFEYDLSEGGLNISPTINPRIDLKVLGSEFRKLARIQIMVNGKLMDLNKLSLDEVSHGYGHQGYVVMGASLAIYFPWAVSRIHLTYYALPRVQTGQYDSWIANNHPFAIIDDASATVLASVGMNERANFFASLVGGKLPKPNGHVAEILAANPVGHA